MDKEKAPAREQELKRVIDYISGQLKANEVTYSELKEILRAIDYHFLKQAKL